MNPDEISSTESFAECRFRDTPVCECSTAFIFSISAVSITGFLVFIFHSHWLFFLFHASTALFLLNQLKSFSINTFQWNFAGWGTWILFDFDLQVVSFPCSLTRFTNSSLSISNDFQAEFADFLYSSHLQYALTDFLFDLINSFLLSLSFRFPSFTNKIKLDFPNSYFKIFGSRKVSC